MRFRLINKPIIEFKDMGNLIAVHLQGRKKDPKRSKNLCMALRQLLRQREDKTEANFILITYVDTVEDNAKFQKVI